MDRADHRSLMMVELFRLHDLYHSLFLHFLRAGRSFVDFAISPPSTLVLRVTDDSHILMGAVCSHPFHPNLRKACHCNWLTVTRAGEIKKGCRMPKR